MKIISRKVHAVLDYLSAIVLIAAPWLLHFETSAAAKNVAIAAGAIILLMSVLTAYEGGLFRKVPMPMHLNADILLGILLAASPWIFGFSGDVYLPHLILGLFAIVVSVLTERSSFSKTI